MPSDSTTRRGAVFGPYWCIAYRDDGTPCLWTARSTRREAWHEWGAWFGDWTPKDRARFRAAKIIVSEVPHAE